MLKPGPPPDSGGETNAQLRASNQAATTSAANKKPQVNNYYFINYMKNKERILNSIRQNETKEAWKHENTVKLINTKKVQLNAKEIFNSIKTQINVESTKIKTISPSKSKRVWLIEFNDENEFQKANNKELRINENTFNLIDANTLPPQNQSVTLKAVLRLHWLPPNFKKEKVSEYLKDRFKNTKIEIKEVEKEHFQEEMSHIENGIIRVKVEYPFEDNCYIISLIGRIEIDSIKALVQLNGYPPRCRHCDSFDHPAKSCPKRDLKCTACNGFFHLASQCTFALRLKQSISKNKDEEESESEYEEDLDEEELEPEPKETKKDKNQNNTTQSNIGKKVLKHSASATNLNTITFATPSVPAVTRSQIIKVDQSKIINDFKTASIQIKRPQERTSLDNIEANHIKRINNTIATSEEKLENQVINIINASDTVTIKQTHHLANLTELALTNAASSSTNSGSGSVVSSSNSASNNSKNSSRSKVSESTKPKQRRNQANNQ